METKKARRVTLRSSIKINVHELCEAPTLGFKLKRSESSSLFKRIRRVSGAESVQNVQLNQLRRSNIVYGIKFRKVFSSFRSAEHYTTGSVREYYVANH